MWFKGLAIERMWVKVLEGKEERDREIEREGDSKREGLLVMALESEERDREIERDGDIVKIKFGS